MVYNKALHKYFLKAFYRKTSKKEYKSQILKHNICHTNVIAILINKILVGSTKKKELVVNTPDTKVTQVCSATNILLKYNWHLDPMDNETVVHLGL